MICIGDGYREAVQALSPECVKYRKHSFKQLHSPAYWPRPMSSICRVMDIDRSVGVLKQNFLVLVGEIALSAYEVHFSTTKGDVVWIIAPISYEAPVFHPESRLRGGEGVDRKRELNMSVLLIGCIVPQTRPMVTLGGICLPKPLRSEQRQARVPWQVCWKR